MKALLTGATGYLGTEILAELLACGTDVVAWGHDPIRVAALKKRFVKPSSRLLIKRKDLLEPELPMSDIDVIIHAAALRPPTAGKDSRLLDAVNIEGTNRMVQLAERSGCKRIVFISSQSVYGPQGAPWSEDAPLHPETAYAKSKRRGEIRVFESNIPCRGIVRLSRLYGVTPLTRWSELPGRFAQAALRGEPLVIHGNGTQRIDLLHVRDAAEAIVMLVDADHLPESFAFNVGGGTSYSLNEFSEVFVRLAPRYGLPAVRVVYQPERRPSGGSHFELCTGLIERTVGWRPHIALDDGVAEYLEALAAER